MKLKMLYDGDTERLWISEKWNNGDWDLYFVLRLEDLEDAMGKEAPAKYGVEVLAISPEAAGAENVRKAAESWGVDDPATLSEEAKVEVLLSYGIYAPLWNQNGGNERKLIQEARKQVKFLGITFGFKMDLAVNRIGDTGWDWIQGNVGASLKRLKTAEA
jgi:hypothetical protein